jgi:CubicO group peptidase (beta-lactamase class C family)
VRALVALALAFAAAQPAWAQTEDPRIRTAETRLGPAVEIAGRPSPARTLAEAMAAMHVPGVSIAVIENKRIAWAKGYGVADAGGAAITTDTRFQAGSISKPIAALAILRLVAEGKLSLDTPVNRWLEGWKLPDGAAGSASGVTLRRLLSHTAGTSVRGFPGYAIGGPVPLLSDVLDGRAPANTDPVRIVAAPGAAWRYSGGGYAVAQKVVEDVTGQRFATWAAGGLLVPAGMTASSFDPPGVTLHALGHGADGATVPGGYHLYPEMAAAGLWSTPSDLARALLALGAAIDGRPGTILPAAIARIVLEPVKPGHSVGFDTGGTPDARWIAKGGDTEGFAAYLVYYPARGQGAVVMTNGAEGATLARDVIRSLAGAYGWPDFRARVRQAAAISPALRESLPGTYVYRKADSFTITRTGEGLSIASPGEASEALYRDPSGEWFTQSQDVAFVFDPDAAGGHIQSGDTAIPFRKKDN